jgi:hypothetical protein
MPMGQNGNIPVGSKHAPVAQNVSMENILKQKNPAGEQDARAPERSVSGRRQFDACHSPLITDRTCVVVAPQSLRQRGAPDPGGVVRRQCRFTTTFEDKHRSAEGTQLVRASTAYLLSLTGNTPAIPRKA